MIQVYLNIVQTLFNLRIILNKCKYVNTIIERLKNNII